MELYVDYMSQPSRACVIFCRMNGLPVEIKQLFIHKGETRSKAYMADVNPLGKVPCLVDADAGLKLPESCAIISYLTAKYRPLVAEHWLPSDPLARAPVEAAQHWQHGNIRAGSMRLAWNKVVAKRLGQPASEELAADALQTLRLALSALERYWLAGGARPYMAAGQAAQGLGWGDGPCVADLLCCCELEQLTMLDKGRHGVDLEGILEPYPAVRAWRARVQAACAPHFEQVHATLRRATAAAAGPGQPAAVPKL